MQTATDNVVVSLGGEHNITAGGNVKVTVAQIACVPCSDPYCDNVIAVEKAKIRGGVCGKCYKESVNTDLRDIARHYFFPAAYIAFPVTLIGVVHLFLNQILSWLDKPRVLPLVPELWIGLAWILFLATKVTVKQNELIRSRNLR